MKLSIRVKLLLSFAVVVMMTAIVGYVGYSSTSQTNDLLSQLYLKNTQSISYIKEASINLYRIRAMVRQSILESDPQKIDTDIQNITTYNQAVRDNLQKYATLISTDSDRAAFSAVSQAYDNYMAAVDGITPLAKQGKDAEAFQAILAAAPITTAIDQKITDIVSQNSTQAQQFYTQSMDAFAQNRMIILALIFACVVVSVAIALFISSSLANPLGILRLITDNMSVGNLNRDMSEATKDKVRGLKDEIGDVAHALTALRIYMTEMAEAAQKVADGDLTVEISAKSDKDELGIAFSQMISNLRVIVGHITENAVGLASASEQLASAASQAGQATSQIATTMTQVARGTAQQTESVTRTAQSVDQMSQAIDGVAKGAQEQATSVAQASTVTGHLNSSIQQLAKAAQGSAEGSDTAARVSNTGVETVSGTIRAMESIRGKVGQSAQKVQEMGTRSQQIGVIVETIEDIASQTNLLALNAAIEAARAGEHGKGFAVVADEVRKLAERASSATKEIGELVRGIQQTVSEAVTAMDAGIHEVEAGVEQAGQAGTALQGIAQTSQEVARDSHEAVQIARKALADSEELVGAMESVSAVVEENTAATEQMAAGSSEVTRSIENIASVSEENSAAVEEVSASAEEMSAQVEEVTASAAALAEMAEALQALVAQFKLEDQAPARREIGRPAKAKAAELPRNGNGFHQTTGRALSKA
jgi:methyl-accepting chemotaxis protein